MYPHLFFYENILQFIIHFTQKSKHFTILTFTTFYQKAQNDSAVVGTRGSDGDCRATLGVEVGRGYRDGEAVTLTGGKRQRCPPRQRRGCRDCRRRPEAGGGGGRALEVGYVRSLERRGEEVERRGGG